MKQKLTAILIGISLFVPLIFVGTTSALACPDGTAPQTIDGNDVCVTVFAEKCPAGQKPAVDGPNTTNKYVCCPGGTEKNATSCFFAKYINPMVYLLTALAGIAVVFGIAMGGIQYASSGGDPQKTAAGKGKVVKALYGLVGFMFLFSALQFMSPGGFSQKNTVPAGASNKAEACSSTFFGLKPWFAYLPDPNFDTNCQIVDFNLLPAKGNPSDVLPVTLAIVDNLVRIAAIVAVVFVVIGGAKYVASQGEPEGVKSAKDSIINALIGLVIAIIAASVVSFIGNRLQ